MKFDLFMEGNIITTRIKSASWFPYKHGNLKFSATGGRLLDANTFRIKFDETVAPYVVYLEEGTRPHEILPRKVNGVLVFTVDGKKVFAKKVYHPGSTKHKDFIKDKCIREILKYFQQKYDAIIEVR